MSHCVVITVRHDEIMQAIRELALERLDIGKPYNQNDARVTLESLPMGAFKAVVVLEVE